MRSLGELAEVQGVIQQVLLLDHLGRGQGRRAGHGVAAVTAGGGDLLEALLVRLAHGHGRDRKAVAKTLADGHHVGHDAPVLHAEPFARASPTGEHFVGHEQQLLLVAVLPQLGEEIVGRHDGAAPALDRLQHEAGHVADGALLDVLVVEGDVLVGVDRAVGLGPQRPVGVGTGDHVGAGHPHAAIDGRADLRQRDGAVGLAVEIVEATEHLVVPVAARSTRIPASTAAVPAS